MIENKIELKNFLTDIGLSKDSNSSYRSRLNFLAKNKIDINSDAVDANNLLDLLEIKSIQFKDKSSLRTALATYKRFLSSDFNLLQDLKEINSKKISKSEKEQLMKARIRQGEYRKKLIDLWRQCSLSQIAMTELLIASHILPWRESTDKERLDKYNGLLLQPNFDIMFDKGYISFNDDGTIILSKKFSDAEFLKFGIDKRLKLNIVYKENIPYLKRHRELFDDILN